MSDVADLLTQAREKIADPEHWTQGQSAVDATGGGADPAGPTAYRWCALGAVSASAYPGRYGDAETAMGILDDCARERGFASKHLDDERPIALLNDGTDHATTLAAFDCAIAKARA